MAGEIYVAVRFLVSTGVSNPPESVAVIVTVSPGPELGVVSVIAAGASTEALSTSSAAYSANCSCGRHEVGVVCVWVGWVVRFCAFADLVSLLMFIGESYYAKVL